MTEAISAIMNWINLYYGNAVFLVMAVFSYLYLYIYNKESRMRIIYPVLLIAFCVVNPILYKFIFSKLIYWRLLWMLPNGIVIAYTVTSIVKKCNKKVVKILIAGIFVMFVLVNGTNAFQYGVFTKTQNAYKISNDVVEVCDVILELDENPRCIMPASLYSEVRQYSGDIEMMYGRDAEGYIVERSIVKYRSLQNMVENNFSDVLGEAKIKGYSFVVTPQNVQIPASELYKHGYKLQDVTDNYNIYYNGKTYCDIENNWYITQYGGDSADTSVFYTIERSDKLIIVDGGSPNNWAKVMNVIDEHDKHIDAWILTNFGLDKVGAFNVIMSSKTDVIVDDIYIMDIAQEVQGWEELSGAGLNAYLSFLEITEKMNNIRKVNKNDIFNVSNLEFQILNGWQEETTNDNLFSNDNRMCFLIDGMEDKVLFLGSVSMNVISNLPSGLDADYIQLVANSENVEYCQKYNSKGFLLEYTDEGSAEQYGLVERISEHTEVYDYLTLPNRIILK